MHYPVTRRISGGQDYSVSIQHGENATVYTIVRLYGEPPGAGWEPVESFRLGDVFQSETGNRYRVERYLGESPKGSPFVEVRQLTGNVFRNELLRFHVGSLLLMTKDAET